MQRQMMSIYATFSCYLLELVTAGRLNISVPGCAFPARQHFTHEINNFCLFIFSIKKNCTPVGILVAHAKHTLNMRQKQ